MNVRGEAAQKKWPLEPIGHGRQTGGSFRHGVHLGVDA